jgi:imidazole glycerol-phosphate synthase subunit HisF
MKRFRIIPTLLINEGKLVKTINFKNPSYVGDPINAVKIFNEKEVDEISIIDMSRTIKATEPNFNLISDIAGEAFMPMSYGGGISSIEIGQKIIRCGVEKLIINNALMKNPEIIKSFKEKFGSQSIVASLDIKKNWFGNYKIFDYLTKKTQSQNIISYAKLLESSGIGEIILNYVDKEGTFNGLNTGHCKLIANNLNIPVILSGGCNGISNMLSAVKDGNASAIAVGSFFIYQLPHRAVMINYPKQKDLIEKVFMKIK